MWRIRLHRGINWIKITLTYAIVKLYFEGVNLKLHLLKSLYPIINLIKPVIRENTFKQSDISCVDIGLELEFLNFFRIQTIIWVVQLELLVNDVLLVFDCLNQMDLFHNIWEINRRSLIDSLRYYHSKLIIVKHRQ